MSKISLTGFFTYHSDSPPRRITLGDVAMPKGMNAPANGLTLLFGFREATEELARQRRRAALQGLELCTVKVEVEVGEVARGRVESHKVGNFRMLYLDRLNLVTMESFMEVLRKVHAEHQIPYESPMVGSVMVTHHPDLIAEAIERFPIFDNLEAYIYQVGDTTADLRQRIAEGEVARVDPLLGLEAKVTERRFSVCTLRSAAGIVDIEPRGLDTEVLLPKKLTNARTQAPEAQPTAVMVEKPVTAVEATPPRRRKRA